MVSEDFPHNTCYIDLQGVASFDPGAWLAGLMKGTSRHCYILNILAVGLTVSEEDFQSFSQVISLWELYVFPYLMNIYMKFHHIWLTTFESNLVAIKMI